MHFTKFHLMRIINARFCSRYIVIIIAILTILTIVTFNLQVKEKSQTLNREQLEALQQRQEQLEIIRLQQRPRHLRPKQTEPPSLQFRPMKVQGMDIYVYTAVAISISVGKTDIRIQAFRNVNEKKTLKCCFRNKHGADVTIDARIKYSYGIFIYRSTAFNCIVDSTDVPKTISLSYNCSLNNGTVLEVSQPEKPKGSISVCCHALYGFPDPKLMTEWFEFIKLQGVGRVFIYPISHKNFVDERSMRVLEYYQKHGLINIIPYALRQYSTDRKRLHQRGDEMFSDEILPVFDCMVRSSLYKYTAYIDFDEVIMFHSNPLDLLGNLDKLLNEKPNAGMFVFKMESFVFNWTATHNSDLIMMKYINRTEALDDRKKMVYIHGRYNAIYPHDASPAAGYRGVVVPESIGAIHHYRSCRTRWTDDYCLKTPRYRDDSMLQFESILNEKVQKVPEHIRNVVEG